ncbi:MAG: hypothetical protein R2939_06290 [Kofleriaceae bacterium]
MSRSPQLAVGVALVLAACGGGQRAQPARPDYHRLTRADVNRLAVRANAPAYWRADTDGDGAIDPDEVVTLRFYPTRPRWVEGGEFTEAFAALYAHLVELADAPAPTDPRLALVVRDLDAGRPTLVETDLSTLPPDHQAFVAEMLVVADLIDELYATQTGAAQLVAAGALDGLDAASASLFRRNRGPRCVSAELVAEPVCSALPGAPRPVVGVYPAALQADPGFCTTLAARNPEVLDDFTGVVDDGGELRAVPYATFFGAPMAEVARHLDAAAAALTDPAEDALRAYLRAAAGAFRTNDWAAADEAWAAMDARSSRWYVRVAPDESYWEPCVRKAGFHLTLALINPGSLAWQATLAPIQQELEAGLATLAGAPYAARQVSFQLPDFIDIVVNAGDDRNPLGATVGQSLPNVGPVADDSRGRTVVMANLYTDLDSRAAERAKDVAILDAASAAGLTDDPTPGLLGTIAHEACHNFGPSASYRPVGSGGALGPTDNDAFGGPLASIMEELKAQTCGLWVIGELRRRGKIEVALEQAAYVDALLWAMGHVGEGMVDADGNPSTYPQLAAIQLGFLRERGALEFAADAVAANGVDRGAYTIHLERLPAEIEALTRLVAGIKARADRAGAEALVRAYVEGDLVPHALLRERAARVPRASFVYAL